MGKHKDFSVTKGYSFSFDDEGRKIVAWFSAISGREKVYVDGELIASRRNLSRCSSTTFRAGQDEYSANLQVVSLFKGPIICTLHKNGKAYKRKKLLFPGLQTQSGKGSFLARLVLFCVLGAVLGFAQGYWQLPDGLFYAVLAILVVMAIVFFDKTSTQGASIQDESAAIENEEIV